MSNARSHSVQIVDTTADFSDPGNIYICGLKYVPTTASSTAVIKGAVGSSSQTIWQAAGSAITYDDIEIRISGQPGYRVEVSNATLYLYMK